MSTTQVAVCPACVPVASVLQPTHSSEHAKQHPYDSVRAALALRRNGTLRKLAHELGFEDKDAGALSDLLHSRYDHVSLETVNRWALALGLPLIPPTKQAVVCPSCLAHGKIEVHGEGLDCHGAPVASVVTLAPGEVVRRNGHAPTPPRPPCFRPRLALDKPTRRAQLLKLLEDCAPSETADPARP